MKPADYIIRQLYQLREFHPRTVPKPQLEDSIFHLLVSKKFRKYSANAELIESIKRAITVNIKNNQPINVTFPHGAYKLWRLQEAPFPDWAELFAAMYYTAWLKPICEIYPPGAWFDYFVDDLILPIIDNISAEEIESYLSGHQKILDFLKSYQASNFRMTITRYESLFASHEDFEKRLKVYVDKFAATNPTFTPRALEMVELNARPTAEQLKDPQWREKVLMIHDPYLIMKREMGYYFQSSKIPIFNQPLASGKFLVVGTTKTSIAKFWVGVGVLKKRGDSYIEFILSPSQVQKTKFTEESIALHGLDGKNFRSIRIFS